MWFRKKSQIKAKALNPQGQTVDTNLDANGNLKVAIYGGTGTSGGYPLTVAGQLIPGTAPIPVCGFENQGIPIGPIPAGTAQIGSVAVSQLPPLPAGENNIGEVSVVSFPFPQVSNIATAVVASPTNPVYTSALGSVRALTLFLKMNIPTSVLIELSPDGTNWYTFMADLETQNTVINLAPANYVRLTPAETATITAQLLVIE